MHFIPKNFDLNLLSIFYALYKHRNVNRAAESLFMSPSAFSHALNRLRSVINDPLFIRIDKEMKPTQLAERIAPSISNSLDILSKNLFSTDNFNYQTNNYEFCIVATEYTTFSILPPIIEECRRLAPNIRLKIVYKNRENSFKNMYLGRVDFTIGYSEQEEHIPENIDSFKCFTDRYVVVVPNGKCKSMDLDRYIKANHIRINAWHEHDGIIDQSLKKLGLKRNIVVEIPNLMSTPYMIESTDLIITLPYKAAKVLQKISSIEIFELPFSVPKYAVNIFSLRKEELTAPQVWLINKIKDRFIYG